jgi:HK97 family phage major capsid protein/HK97 family phage prohead protease
MTETLSYEVKYSAPTEAGTFEGLASIFGREDMAGDIVQRGAFKRTLNEHRAAGRMPALLWAHDPAEVIGRFTDIQETREGLLVRGKLNLSTQRGAEARALLQGGDLSGLSIGFRTRSAERRSKGRTLTDIDLLECSLVAMPCAPDARVFSIKSNGERRLIQKDSSTMTDLTYEDGAAEPAVAELPTEVLSRIAAVETKANTVDEIAARIDKIETRLSRPGAPRIEVREDPQAETKAFVRWCRRGWDGMGDLEKKILGASTATSPSTQGWQLVPEQFLTELQKNLVEFSPMRQVARVQQVGGSPVKLPKRTANLAAGWVAETSEHSVSEPVYGQQEIPIFEARVSTEVTNALLEDSAFNLASELAQDFAEEFARLEGAAFVLGNGTTQPQGFLISSDFTTISGGAALDSDDLITLYHSLASVYASRGTWLMRRETIGSVRKLTATGTGTYLWSDSLQPGNPPTLLGRPVVEMPDMPILGSPAEVLVAFGDWSRAYRVFDRIGLEVLRDPYSLARNSIVTFHARRRVGGALVDGAAVKGLTA